MPHLRKPPKLKVDVPVDEAMRIERPSRIARPRPIPEGEAHPTPAGADGGPHVDRVGMPAPDE